MKQERQSWGEEHKEFPERATHITPGDKWSFGFFQVVADPKSPITKLKDNSLTEFLIPESYLSLKLFFDNLRNYGICAAFMALGAWTWLNMNGAMLSRIPIWLSKTFVIGTWLLVGCLLVLNCIQTWILTTELYFSLRAIRVSRFHIYRKQTTFQGLLSVSHILVNWLIDAAMSFVVLLAALAVVSICIGFVVYSVQLR